MDLTFGPQQIFNLLSQKYETAFFSRLAKNQKLGIFIYGGLVRSLVLGRPWKDVDLRIIIDADWEEREQVMEAVLDGQGDMELKRRFEFENFTLYRFLPQGCIGRPLDITLSNRMDVAPSDYTINSVFVNLRTGEIHDPHHGLNDLENKVVRAIKEPQQLLIDEPWAPFRAIKSACQLGFSIDSELLANFKANINCIRQPLHYICQNHGDLWAETQLANLFSGLGANPEIYYRLCEKLGIFPEIIAYFSERLQLSPAHHYIYGHSQFIRGMPLEQLISTMLSAIARAIAPEQAERIFERIVTDMALDQAKAYGEIDILPTEIKYL